MKPLIVCYTFVTTLKNKTFFYQIKKDIFLSVWPKLDMLLRTYYTQFIYHAEIAKGRQFKQAFSESWSKKYQLLLFIIRN